MEFSKHLTFYPTSNNTTFKIQLPTNLKTSTLTLNISNDTIYKLSINFNHQTFYYVNSLTDISYNIPLSFGYEFEIVASPQLPKSTISSGVVNINISQYDEKLNLNYQSLETYINDNTPFKIFTFNYSISGTHRLINNSLINNSIPYMYIKELHLFITNRNTQTQYFRPYIYIDNDVINFSIPPATETKDYILFNNITKIDNMSIEMRTGEATGYFDGYLLYK